MQINDDDDDLFIRRQVKAWSRNDVIFAYEQNIGRSIDSTCDDKPRDWPRGKETIFVLFFKEKT